MLLLEQIGKELEHERGWPKKAAERTGLSLSYVRKYLSGERTGVTVAMLDKIRRRMRLSRRFFTDASLGDHPQYQDFVGAPDDGVPEAFAIFRETYPRFEELSERQRQQLLDMEFRGGRPTSPHVYRAVADWLLDGGGDPSRQAETEQAAKAEGVRRVGSKYRKKQ